MLRMITAELFSSIPTALALRSSRFPSSDGKLVGIDEFDARSLHIVFREASQIAAYGRLTTGAPGVFRTWSREAAQIPEEEEVADLGRCCVQPEYARLELLRSVRVEAFVYCLSQKLGHVNGTHIPGRNLVGSLHEMGFRAAGPCVESFEPNGNKMNQPVTCELKESMDMWPAPQLRSACNQC